MTTPYASVILPTLDRSATLPYALASVAAQTETSLEIVVALDGATPACREIAVAAARADRRIVVLDLPKRSKGGEASVDAAVRRAKAARIFYIDDDDLWLPDHVASLGPLLDEADIADSRVCSVDRRGGLHLGPCRGANPRIRELLAGKPSLKMIYDTHIAHRSDAYGRLSSWLAPGETGVAVWDFLAAFARHPGCRWASHDAVTALSIHGAARADMSAEDRAREIADWAGRLGGLRGELARADSAFHLLRLLMADSPRGAAAADYLAARGFYDAALKPREAVLFALFTATPLAPDDAVALAVALAEPVESGYMFESIAFACFAAYGQDNHELILQRAAAHEGGNLAARLAAYSVALSRRDPSAALDVARRAVALGPDPAGSLARWCEGLERRAAGVAE